MHDLRKESMFSHGLIVTTETDPASFLLDLFRIYFPYRRGIKIRICESENLILRKANHFKESVYKGRTPLFSGLQYELQNPTADLSVL